MNTNPANLICREIFGIDPGKNGAISKYTSKGIEIIKMPEDFESLCNYFRNQSEICVKPLIFLEKISTFKDDLCNISLEKIKQHIGKQRNIDKLKVHYSELRCSIKVAKIPYLEIMTNTIVKSVRMRKELADKIQSIADKENKNFSNTCETLLIKILNGFVRESGESFCPNCGTKLSTDLDDVKFCDECFYVQNDTERT